MSNGTAAKLAFAGLVSIAGCISPDPGPTAAVVPSMRVFEVRHQVDPARQRVWWLTRDGVFLHDVSKPQRIALKLPGRHWAGAPYGCLPDLALGPNGEAVVTSDVLPRLWRIDPDTLAVSMHPLELDADTDKDVGFSGIVYSRQQKAFFAASYPHGSLWRIDPTLRQARKIPLSAPIPDACGLAVRSRSSHQALSGPTDLCVHTPHRGWSVVFSPNGRFAYVSAVPCGQL